MKKKKSEMFSILLIKNTWPGLWQNWLQMIFVCFLLFAMYASTQAFIFLFLLSMLISYVPIVPDMYKTLRFYFLLLCILHDYRKTKFGCSSTSERPLDIRVTKLVRCCFQQQLHLKLLIWKHVGVLTFVFNR